MIQVMVIEFADYNLCVYLAQKLVDGNDSDDSYNDMPPLVNSDSDDVSSFEILARDLLLNFQ